MQKVIGSLMAEQGFLDVALEAQGSRPNFRYDIILPIIHGRVPIPGVALHPSPPMEVAGFFDNPKFKSGDFGLLDTNIGDVLSAIDAGWDVCCLPVFIKRKPVYNYLWVRADRGIDSPRDLEGKTVATLGYNSAITIFTRGLLRDLYGVRLENVGWLLNAPGPFPIHNRSIRVDIAAGPPKSPAQRLLAGEVDASTGDIVDLAAWRELESSPTVKRLFPDYQAENEKLLRDQGLYTPVHIIVMGGKLNREHPSLARTLYDAFDRSRELAYEDALSDAASHSLKMAHREAIRDQLRDFGDLYQHGVAKNRRAIEQFADYCHDQGVTRSRLTLDKLFAPSTLDT